jgi:hypothetical protein
MTLAATATLALAWACTGTVKVEREGPNEEPDSGQGTLPDAGSGGTGGRSEQGATGGVSQGGSGGQSPGGRTVTAAEEAACAAYQRARCARTQQCGTGTCDEIWDCPSELFAAGTSRTVEGVTACAKVVAAQECEDWTAPPCVTPGKLPRGAPCAYHTQCQSFFCASDHDSSALTCGTCKNVGEWDGPCDENTECQPYQQCVGARCQGSEPTYTDLPIGGDCSHERQRDDFVQCAEGLLCEDTFADGGFTSACVDIPGLGEACKFFCELPAVCSEGTCQMLPHLGEDCLVNDHAVPVRGLCDGGARCLDRKCAAKGKRGDPCEPKDDADVQCETGRCECAGSDCTRYVCAERRYAGESCADPNTVCHYGTRCEGGVCVSGALGKPHVDGCD